MIDRAGFCNLPEEDIDFIITGLLKFVEITDTY
jgi:hypothetical protein